MAGRRRSPLLELSDSLAELVAAVIPGLVSLESSRFTGSGWIWDDEGHVVTNHHVVEGAGATMRAVARRAKLGDAQVVGHDAMSDLAVLRLPSPSGVALRVRSAPARLGELCLALGSPLGAYPESVSLGIVSGVARSLPQAAGRSIERVVQTDCAINPGNSGGPLVDAGGEVLGVNMSVDSRGAGIGFAVPADTTALVVTEILEHGAVARASLGVAVALRDIELDGGVARRMVVTKVNDKGSPLRKGDVLLAMDGEVLDERDDLYNHLDRARIGTTVAVALLRDGGTTTVDIVPTALAPKTG